MALDPEQREQILKSIKKLVLAHHINVAGVDYESWTKCLDTRVPELLRSDETAFEAGVRNVLAELKSSHTAFYHDRPEQFPPQHTINATLRRVTQDGTERWMFLNVFHNGPAQRAGIKPGDILHAIDGTSHVPPLAPTFAIGRVHKLAVSSGISGGLREVVVDVPLRKGTKQRPPIIEPVSPLHKMLADGVGLLSVPYFPGAMGMRFTKALDSAIQKLKDQGCKRLIVDLRGNIGGSLGFARLASYLCPGQIAIGHSLTPSRLRNGYEPDNLPRVPMPGGRAELLLTLARFSFRDKSVMLLTQGLGRQPFHNRVVVLVNEWTNSAAEMAAAFAGDNRLATVLGERTRGNVLGAMNFKVGSGYWLRLPVFGWFTSEGRSLEGTGVAPDVVVEIDPDALAAGHDNQLESAIEIATAL